MAGRRRPRNKVAALPLRLRRGVAGMLLDGCTYAECGEWLTAQGVGEERLPGNSAYRAYRSGREFGDLRDERLELEHKHEAQRRLSEALKANGTIEDQAKTAVYVAMSRVLDALQDGDADTAEILRAVTGVQKTLNETAKLELARKQAAGEDSQGVTVTIDGDDLAAALDRAMGVAK